METIFFKNEEIKLHSTFQLNEFYTGDIPEILINCLAKNFILTNNRLTCFEDMAYSEVDFKDTKGNEYTAYVTYTITSDDFPIDNYAEFLTDESNFRIKRN